MLDTEKNKLEIMQEMLSLWDDIKVSISETELDAIKNSRGNQSAGKRLRKALRITRKNIENLGRLSLSLVKIDQKKE